jgi:hypothetical protein
MSQGNANPNISTSGSAKVMPVLNPDYGACDEGSFFVTTLANTASTAVACTTQALADTNPALGLFNGAASGGYNIILRYIKMRVTVVGGTNSSKNYSSVVEQRTDKLSTTGTALGTPQNTNTSSSVRSLLSGFGGVNIAAAANATVRRVGDGSVNGAVEVAFDQWVFAFGEPVTAMSQIGDQTKVSIKVVSHAPVILAPGWWYTLGVWGASQAASADTFGWEIGYIERPSGQ